jgi:hypothetical protein
MNVLAHAHVALRVLGGGDGRRVEERGAVEPHAGTAAARAVPGGVDAYVLGAVLPDLAPAAGVRLDRAALPIAVADGVRCHTRSDAAFHALPVFARGARAIRRALDERGVASGPARAVGHAGWELLLDGTLVASQAEDAFRRAVGTAGHLSGALPPADAERWAAFLARGRTSPGLGFDDPTWVAERLYRMLHRRPRLRLPRHQVEVVADVLADARPSVVAAAPDVLHTTARAVREA